MQHPTIEQAAQLSLDYRLAADPVARQAAVAAYIAAFEAYVPSSTSVLIEGVLPGWWDIVNQAISQGNAVFAQYPDTPMHFTHIKEKLGGLRIHYGAIDRNQTPPMEALVALREIARQAASQANQKCQVCGDAGQRQVVGGWISNLCETHHKTFVDKR